jgi:CRP-like cAMP-binding protein
LHQLTRSDTQRRVAWALELLARRFAESSTSCDERRLPFRVKQGELARLAGTSRQTVNRVLGQLQGEQRLRFEAGKMVLRGWDVAVGASGS